MFGTRKIYCKIINSKLVVRVGGGFMGIEDFILQYGELEAEKYSQMMEDLQNPNERTKSGFNLIDIQTKFKNVDSVDASPANNKSPLLKEPTFSKFKGSEEPKSA